MCHKREATVRETRPGSFFKYVDVRPAGITTLKGDCTTRCIAFCLEMDYSMVKNEQHLWAESARQEWNGGEFWDTMLRKRGWRRIYFPNPVVKYRVAEATKDIDHPMATSTYNHVCPIFQGKVIDLSDTTLQRVQYVVCHKDDYTEVKRALKPLIQESKEKLKMKLKTKKSKMRHRK